MRVRAGEEMHTLFPPNDVMFCEQQILRAKIRKHLPAPNHIFTRDQDALLNLQTLSFTQAHTLNKVTAHAYCHITNKQRKPRPLHIINTQQTNVCSDRTPASLSIPRLITTFTSTLQHSTTTPSFSTCLPLSITHPIRHTIAASWVCGRDGTDDTIHPRQLRQSFTSLSTISHSSRVTRLHHLATSPPSVYENRCITPLGFHPACSVSHVFGPLSTGFSCPDCCWLPSGVND